MDKKSQFKKLLPMILMLAVSVAIGITGATVLHTLTLENPIKTPTVEGEVKEEDLEKGGKKISFINTGEADVFIRASISESWTYEKDGKSCILPNKVGEIKVALPYGNVAEVSGSAIRHKGGGTDWIYNPSDGWYYYRKVLPGSKTKGNNEAAKKTSLLVEGVEFPQLQYALQTDKRYKDATYELHCTMEVVQASDEKEVSIAAVKKMFFNDGDVPNGFLSNWPGSWSKPEEWTDEWKNAFDSAPTHDTKYQVDISWN